MKQLQVYLKFKKRADNGQLYGFVSKKDKKWIGVTEDDKRKKRIVFLDEGLVPTTMENVLYKAQLIPMKSATGFVAIGLKPVQFDSKIVTDMQRDSFIIKIIFGNRVFTYNPFSKHEKERSIAAISNLLRHRIDLRDSQKVADDFERVANSTFQYYHEMKKVS